MTSDETEAFQQIMRMYPEASDPISAIVKYVIHSIEQSDSEDHKHETRLANIERSIKKIEKEIDINHSQADITEADIIPSGGAGTWDEETIKTKLL